MNVWRRSQVGTTKYQMIASLRQQQVNDSKQTTASKWQQANAIAGQRQQANATASQKYADEYSNNSNTIKKQQEQQYNNNIITTENR